MRNEAEKKAEPCRHHWWPMLHQLHCRAKNPVFDADKEADSFGVRGQFSSPDDFPGCNAKVGVDQGDLIVKRLSDILLSDTLEVIKKRRAKSDAPTLRRQFTSNT